MEKDNTQRTMRHDPFVQITAKYGGCCRVCGCELRFNIAYWNPVTSFIVCSNCHDGEYGNVGD